MSGIPNTIKGSVFYLYEDEEAAKANKKVGGTGFFVYMDSKNGKRFFYAVTNRHVIEKGLATVIRVNAVGGKSDIISLSISDWIYHPSDADVAVASIDIKIKFDLHSFTAIPRDWFIPKEEIDDELIMLCSDVFMLGRFIHYAGQSFNMPVARSGIVSAFPNSKELIPVAGMKPQEAFLIEMRSLSGFSGSPTFHILPMSNFNNSLKVIMEDVYDIKLPPTSVNLTSPLFLLGIDAGAFSIYEDVFMEDETVYEPTKYKAMNHSGFSIVIPAWKIAETLDRPEFLIKRKERKVENTF